MAVCTWATEAFAIGFSSKEVKTFSIKFWISTSIIFFAIVLEKGSILSCNFFKYSHIFLSTKSGLVDKACPNLIYPGPKSVKQRRSFFPTSSLFGL